LIGLIEIETIVRKIRKKKIENKRKIKKRKDNEADD
jgi:hypothetical protein